MTLNKKPYPVVKKMGGSFVSLADKVAKLVAEGVSHGMSARTATDYAFRKLNIRHLYGELTVQAVGEVLGGKTLAVVGKKFITKPLIPAPLQKEIVLKPGVWKSVKGAQVQVKNIVSNKLIQQKSWVNIAREIKAKELSKGMLTKKVDSLITAARRMNTGDAKAIAGYKAEVTTLAKHIDTLAANGSPTSYLKKAYQRIVDATVKGSDKAVKVAVDKAVSAKMRYEAEGVVRTEVAEIYGQDTYNELLSDDDVVGVRSVLSDRHVVDDICNMYAEVDSFGMGAGVFPKDYAPPYPYHPNCLCSLEPVYQGELKGKGDFNKKAVDKWLSKQPEHIKKSTNFELEEKKINVL